MSTPLAAVSYADVVAQIAGLEPLIPRVAAKARRTPEAIAAGHVVSAMSDLRRISRYPFFETRFATPEIALELNLTQGTDYDEIIDPMDYIVDSWLCQSGRMQLPWAPVKVTAPYQLRLATASGGSPQEAGIMVDVPTEWINWKAKAGEAHILPRATGSGALLYARGSWFFQLYRGGVLSGVIPNVLHWRYTAGLVAPVATDGTPYDPEGGTYQSLWASDLVEAYREMIAKRAAAKWLPGLASELNRGGLQIALDGLSRQVTPGVLTQRQQDFLTETDLWAKTLKLQEIGIGFASA